MRTHAALPLAIDRPRGVSDSVFRSHNWLPSNVTRHVAHGSMLEPETNASMYGSNARPDGEIDELITQPLQEFSAHSA